MSKIGNWLIGKDVHKPADEWIRENFLESIQPCEPAGYDEPDRDNQHAQNDKDREVMQ